MACARPRAPRAQQRSKVVVARKNRQPLQIVTRSARGREMPLEFRPLHPGGTTDPPARFSRPSGTWAIEGVDPTLKRWAIIECPSGTVKLAPQKDKKGRTPIKRALFRERGGH
jgi:hypothetical protein